METREQRYFEVVTENGTKRTLTFEPGRDTGVWCLAGDDTLHPASPEIDGARLFLRFDGARLFVGTQWSEIAASTQMSVAGLRIAYGVGAAPAPARIDDDEATAIRPPIFVPSEHGLAATRVGAPPVERGDEKTRVQPPLRGLPPSPPLPTPSPSPKPGELSVKSIEAAAARPLDLAAPRPLVDVKRVHGDDETRVGPPPEVRHRKVTSPAGAAPAPSATKPTSLIGKVTPMQAGILAMMIVVVGMVIVGTSRPKAPTAQVTKAATPAKTIVAASRAAAPELSPAVGAASPTAGRPAAATPSGATPSVAALAAAPSVALAAASEPAPSAAAPVHSAAATPAPALSGTVDERAAVLAVQSGATDRAARLYDALASLHPDKPAYQEAARILRAKSAQ